MATVIPFPQQQQHIFTVTNCAGCQEVVTDSYWEVSIPKEGNKMEHIALCDECNEELMKHGVVL